MTNAQINCRSNGIESLIATKRKRAKAKIWNPANLVKAMLSP